ncbi:MAG: DUF3343 domain-containing protein [Spirochaetota bacterium]
MNETQTQYCIALFKSVSHVLHAEKILKEANVPHKIIPVPKKISSECGVCVRFLPEHSDEIRNTLYGKVEEFEIRKLP